MSLESQSFSHEWYKCEPCKTSFADEGKWARHMQRHKGEPGKDEWAVQGGAEGTENSWKSKITIH